MITGTGIDIIEISRIALAIERWGDGFLNHVFTKEEIIYARRQRHPDQHFAARFAAKEAVIKALSNHPNLSWKDIQITNDKNGKPNCRLKDKNFKKKIFISISHAKDYAVASAIITT